MDKHVVPADDYLSNAKCWGGVGLQEEGTWIPVEFALDKTEHFTRIGIVSRNCIADSLHDIVIESNGQVPPFFLSERHADAFEFVMPVVKDPDNLLGSTRLLTSVSTVHVKYSENVVFFNGHIMLGPRVEDPTGRVEFYNVVQIKK